jgi:hypothetical protein
LPFDDRHPDVFLKIERADRLHRVDRGDAIGPAFKAGFSDRDHIGDIRSHLSHERKFGAAPNRRAVLLAEFGIASDVASHRVRGHLGAAEVQFEHVRAGFGR